MSAFAYIEASDIPWTLMDSAARRTVNGETLIAFRDCPLTGIAQEDGEIQFPFPRDTRLRAELRSWFDFWSLSHRVER